MRIRHCVPLLLGLLAGCAAGSGVRVEHNADAGLTTYRTSRILVGHRDMSSGLASGQRIMLEAQASCAGPDCRPDVVDLVFFNAADSELNIDARRVEVSWEGAKREWEMTERVNEPAYAAVPRGEFVRVSIDREAFSQMAEAERVEIAFGSTATSRFGLGASKLRPLAELAEAIGSD